MSVRIDRAEAQLPRMEGEGIRASPHIGGPLSSPNLVPDSLLALLKAQFPNVVPGEVPGENPIMTLGKARGRQEVIAYLEHLNNEE